jgi:hypothetical protein
VRVEERRGETRRDEDEPLKNGTKSEQKSMTNDKEARGRKMIK